MNIYRLRKKQMKHKYNMALRHSCYMNIKKINYNNDLWDNVRKSKMSHASSYTE